jgi:REP-associated tyrosine transposase
MKFRTWGGARKGAGRKPKRERGGVPHLMRPALKRRFPVHATWKMGSAVWKLRSQRCFSVLKRAMWKGSDQFGFRLVHYSVMGDHMHLLVEATDRRALGRGMKGLGVRIARALNRLMRRRGNVLGDRYHAHILKTPTEVKRARHYLLTNAHKHYGWVGADPYASQAAVVAPETWMLRRLE